MKLSQIINEFVGPDPDRFYRAPGAIPFIYGEEIGLITGGPMNSHYDRSFEHDLLDDYGGMPDDVLDNLIMGRIGSINGIVYMAIWNDDLNMINKCIFDIIDEFAAMNEINDDTVISTATGDLITVGQLHETYGIRPNKQADYDKIEKLRNLHLMQPQQKKKAMAELGLATHGGKHPYQKAAEQNKLIQPGQKWWSMTSESKNETNPRY